MTYNIFFYSLIGGLFSLIGGLIVLWKSDWAEKIIYPLISFGAGAFMAAAFLDILPEALAEGADYEAVLTSALAGFVLYFLLDRLIMKYFFHKHEKMNQHSDHTESLPTLLILGDCVHNFMDGIAIAIAMVANPALGLPTAIAIASHEIPQEIGDFSILLKLKWEKKTIIAVNVLQSLLTIPGVLFGYFLGNFVSAYLPLLLGGTAGIFIYIAASDLIPELHHQSGHKHFLSIIIPFVASILLIRAVVGMSGV